MSKSRRNAAPPPRKPHGREAAIEWIKSIVIGFLIFIVLRTLVLQTFTIISASMEDTLLIGDFLVVNKLAYGARLPGGSRVPGYTHPKHGDIVVFISRHDNPPIDLVKRLIGVPGDTLAMHDGVLFRDRQPLDEPYVKRLDPAGDAASESMEWQRAVLTDSAAAQPYHPTRDNWGPIVIPPGHYLMLGDNRDQSLDSRYWGLVDAHDVKGKASLLYFSWNRFGEGLSRVRWSRIGDRLP